MLKKPVNKEIRSSPVRLLEENCIKKENKVITVRIECFNIIAARSTYQFTALDINLRLPSKIKQCLFYIFPARPHLRRIKLIFVVVAVHELVHDELAADGGIIFMILLDEFVDLLLAVHSPLL